jgi:hypothetical protein
MIYGHLAYRAGHTPLKVIEQKCSLPQFFRKFAQKLGELEKKVLFANFVKNVPNLAVF